MTMRVIFTLTCLGVSQENGSILDVLSTEPILEATRKLRKGLQILIMILTNILMTK